MFAALLALTVGTGVGGLLVLVLVILAILWFVRHL